MDRAPVARPAPASDPGPGHVPGPRPAPRRRWPIILGLSISAFVLAIILIAASLVEGGPSGADVQLSGRQEVAQLYRGIRQDGPELGAQDAPVQVSVFNDIQCSPCAQWQLRTLPALTRGQVRGDRVRLRFRNFSVSERDRTVSQFATAAAGRQNTEWEFLDLLERNLAASGPTIDEPFLGNVANAVGLDPVRWRADRRSASVRSDLDTDAALALSLRLPAQPAVVVSGPAGERKLIDSPSLAAIQRAIATTAG